MTTAQPTAPGTPTAPSGRASASVSASVSDTGPGIAEPKPGVRSADHEIFLTPRVLDAGAYSQYTAALKALLAELDARAATLTATSADTDKLCSVLRQAAAQLKARIDAADKAEQALERRAAAAEQAIARITKAVGGEAELSELAEKVAARHRDAFSRRVSESLATVEARIDSRLGTQLEAKLEAAEARAAAAERRANAAEKKLDTLTGRLDALTLQAETIDARTIDALASAESTAELATTNAIEAIEQLRTLADEIRETAGADAESIESKLGPVRDLIASAATLVGTDDEPGTLATNLAAATDAAGRLETTNAETERQLAAAAQAHAAIVDTVSAATESLESLRVRRDELRTSIESELEDLAAEVSPLERAAGTLRRSLDELAGRTQTIYNDIASAQETLRQAAEKTEDALRSDPTTLAEQRIAALQEAAQAITDQTLKQVEEAAEWLAALAAQAHPPEPIDQRSAD